MQYGSFNTPGKKYMRTPAGQPAASAQPRPGGYAVELTKQIMRRDGRARAEAFVRASEQFLTDAEKRDIFNFLGPIAQQNQPNQQAQPNQQTQQSQQYQQNPQYQQPAQNQPFQQQGAQADMMNMFMNMMGQKGGTNNVNANSMMQMMEMMRMMNAKK
jgi:hypothetical protein